MIPHMKRAALLLLLLFACREWSPTAPAEKARPAAPNQQAGGGRRHPVSRTREIAPACAAPAPFSTASIPGPGYIVMFQPGTDPVVTTARLESTFGFKARHIFDVTPGLSAEISLQTVAALRCMNEVQRIEENAVGTVGGAPAPCSN
jgi:hypothetical protein